MEPKLFGESCLISDMSAFSIVMPCYNAERYLRAALDSVVMQAWKDWECVCTDDGSVDATGTILDEYAARDSRFKVIHQGNGGEGAARNAALEVINGDWFLFLDADDVMNPEHLYQLSRAIKRCPFSDLFIYGSTQFKENETPVWPQEDDNYREFECSFELPQVVIGMGVCAGAYYRKKYGNIRFSKLKIGADLVYVSECMKLVGRAAVLGITGFGYRIVANSMSHRERTPSLMIDTIDFRRITFENLVSSGKVLPNKYVRSAGNQWFESTPSLFAWEPRSGIWGTVWEHWFDSLDIAVKMPFFSRWQKGVIRIIRMTRSRMLAWILCVFPHCLKCMGIHR